ncbi:MAG: ATP-binding protein [Planctomycetota bacterium]|nr:ATP-binding protein [Planctomycetota bacterium]
MANIYEMTISWLTVDKLGMHLYDRVSAVIAELVANSYDADATEVEVVAPMEELLATKSVGNLKDKGYAIEVRDNGVGMTPEEVNAFYLVVGAERRNDPKRGGQSKLYKRKVMGRKGVGKLAPFGVCQRIEIITSGGEPVGGKDESGNAAKGYLTGHLVLDRSKILGNTDAVYSPIVGELDGVVRPKHGMTLKLTIFDHRKVPKIDDFERQLAQRFGVASPNWGITLFDSLKTESDPTHSRVVGAFSVDQMPNTQIRFEEVLDGGKPRKPPEYAVFGPNGKKISDLTAGFEYEGNFFPVTGWVAYSKQPYKDDLMAGIRIYCRGKIAAQTHIFNLRAGFTGEYDIRSYLVGSLQADWLDEEDDLIRTDRQDILWSHELGQEFEKWGREIVKYVGTIAKEPKRKKAWELFEETAKIHERVKKAFPADSQKEIRDNSVEIAKAIAQTMREEELKDPQQVDSLVNLSLLFGPHITLDRKLREAAESTDDPLSVITSILKTAKIAELAGFGKIADDRVRVIKKIEELKDDPNTLEAAFQTLIEEAPWLINPQWSPITANLTFTTLKAEFQKFYKKQTRKDLILKDFSDPRKRADFVLSSQDTILQIVEIKKPAHAIENEEMARINTYVELMEEFLSMPGHEEFKAMFPDFHVTLVCDDLNLKGVYKTAFEGLKNQRRLTYITWSTFLLRTRRMHEEFLKEAERQRKNAAKD